MANFNPDIGISPTQIQDQTRASRGIPTNNSMETLFGGIGDAVKGVAQTADTAIQRNIRTDVENYTDVVNQQFGVGPQAGALGASTAVGQDNAQVQNNPAL